MSHLQACRICLAYESRMFSILNGPLQELYEKITDLPLEMKDVRPVYLCYICYYMLGRFQKFKEKSIKANQLLSHLISSDSKITVNSLSLIVKQQPDLRWNMTIAPIQNLTHSESDEKLKMEVTYDIVTVKSEKEDEANDQNETVSDDIDYEPALDTNNDTSTDSEDDLPLQNIKKSINGTDIIKIKPKVKTKRNKNAKESKGRDKLLKPDAREIILTKEEQIQEMMERSKSLNYLNCPFKCDSCYKGFLDMRAFENHKEKHDERSGSFECDVCHMRYRSARHLRTHAVTSHERQYACNKCDHRSHTPNQAREHDKWHSGVIYECQLCSHKFRKSTSYLTHMRKRHPSSHVCGQCGESFVSKHGLSMHCTKVHRGKQVSNVASAEKHCSECNVHFVTIEAYNKHILYSVKHSLSNLSRSTCLVCDAEVSPDKLKAHLQDHQNALKSPKNPSGKPNTAKVPCDQCGASFVNTLKLQAHIKRMHLGLKYNKNIVCEVCGKKCTSNAGLVYHQRTHTGERPYACTSCPKRFTDKNQLRIHMRAHSGERPYACALCGKRFSQKPALNRHYRVHTGVKPYDCKFCAKTFSQSNSMKLHVNSVHLKMPYKKKSNNTQTEEENNVIAKSLIGKS